MSVNTSLDHLPVACPLCGAYDGYRLTDGSTYRWWNVYCKGCGEQVTECASDRRTQLGTQLPESWPRADQGWNEAGAYAENMRRLLREWLTDGYSSELEARTVMAIGLDKVK